MRLSSSCVVAIALVLLASAVSGAPGERDRLNACKAMVDRAAQAGAAPGGAVEDAELQKCRQIIKEWTLRDSRMSVDEQGRPLR
jgi:hypothetical protein